MIILPEIPKEIVSEFDLLRDKVCNSNRILSPFELIEKIYSFTNKYNVFISSFAVCKKSCSYCCLIDVSTKQIEVEYISYMTNIDVSYTREMTANHDSKCPFLNENSQCSIYNYRPYHCRTFHTLDDPKYCATKLVSHAIYGSPSHNSYGSTIYKIMADWLETANTFFEYGSKDIRDWFPLK